MSIVTSRSKIKESRSHQEVELHAGGLYPDSYHPLSECLIRRKGDMHAAQHHSTVEYRRDKSPVGSVADVSGIMHAVIIILRIGGSPSLLPGRHHSDRNKLRVCAKLPWIPHGDVHKDLFIKIYNGGLSTIDRVL